MAGRTRSASKTLQVSTRERCLDATAIVLARHGYAGTRLSDIVREANVQAPALYYYFESREALIEEVVGLGQKETADMVHEALKALADATPTERIEAAIAAHLRSVFRTTTLAVYARAATRARSQMPAEAQARFRVTHRAYIDAWRTLFEEAAAAGEISADLDPGLARMVVLGAMNWATEWWRPGRGPLEDLIETVQRIALLGLQREPSGPSPRARIRSIDAVE